MLGATWGLIVKRALYADPRDWPPCSSDILFLPLVPAFPRLRDPSTMWHHTLRLSQDYKDHPTMRYLQLSHDYVTTRVQMQANDKLTFPASENPVSFLWGIRRPRQKGGELALFKGQSPSPFPYNKFSSLCLNTWLVLFFSLLALQLVQYRRSPIYLTWTSLVFTSTFFVIGI